MNICTGEEIGRIVGNPIFNIPNYLGSIATYAVRVLQSFKLSELCRNVQFGIFHASYFHMCSGARAVCLLFKGEVKLAQ